MRNAYEIFVGKFEGKKPLGQQRCRLEDNIKMGIEGNGVRMWIGFMWLRIESKGELL
jgi:hypothetical protein